MDVRSATSLPLVPALLATLREQGIIDQAAVPGRHHRHAGAPLLGNPAQAPAVADRHADAADLNRALVDAIELERELLAALREQAHVIDTSLIRPSQLQGYVKDVISLPGSQLTLVFESFAFKRGIPVDADYVFDVRMLPNPHYEPELRPLDRQRRSR